MTQQRKQATITKNTLNDLVKDLDPTQVESLFKSATGSPAPMQSKVKLINELGLTGANKKKVEDFVYPSKDKGIKDLSDTVLLNTIKKLNKSIKELQDKKSEYQNELDKRMKG